MDDDYEDDDYEDDDYEDDDYEDDDYEDDDYEYGGGIMLGNVSSDSLIDVMNAQNASKVCKWGWVDLDGVIRVSLADYCHAGMKNVTFPVRQVWNKYYPPMVSKKLDAHFHKWFNGPNSPWKLITTNPGFRYIPEVGWIFEDLTAIPIQLLANFLIASRMPSEHETAAKQWYELVKKGVSETLAYQVVTAFYCLDGLWKQQTNGWHWPLDGWSDNFVNQSPCETKTMASQTLNYGFPLNASVWPTSEIPQKLLAISTGEKRSGLRGAVAHEWPDEAFMAYFTNKLEVIEDV
jgi:hypothetical protein